MSINLLKLNLFRNKEGQNNNIQRRRVGEISVLVRSMNKHANIQENVKACEKGL